MDSSLDRVTERKGRVWSSNWIFEENTSFDEDRSNNGSVYAVVPGGRVGHDAVIEMQMRGVSGAHYRLAANAIGPETADVRVGRSAPVSGHKVTPDYKLYLNPPSQALYNWVEPIVSDVEITPSCGSSVACGTSVALDTAPDASASPPTYSGSTWGVRCRQGRSLWLRECHRLLFVWCRCGWHQPSAAPGVAIGLTHGQPGWSASTI